MRPRACGQRGKNDAKHFTFPRFCCCVVVPHLGT
jgi:hypothetical protein